MKLKKAKKIKEIELCNRLEMGETNQIQPHGVWIELDSKMRITKYSENAPGFLETSLEDLLGHDILYFLKPERSKDNIALWLKTPFTQYKPAIWSTSKKQIPVLIFSHQENGVISLEIERNIEPNIKDNTYSYYNEFVMTAMKKTLKAKTIDELTKIACAEIKKLTGYNRIIIYKFDSIDYTGIVIGEAFDKGMASYIGLRFPATDIPASVRKMYIKLPLRYIPTILEQPVKIVSRKNQKTPQAANLTSANLRMVAPVHVEYMHNMGICSSTSVAIMQRGKLWGLIACHHIEPKYLSQTHRYILDLFANIISAQALAIESIEHFQEEQQIGIIYTELTNIFRQSESLTDALAKHNKELMQLMSSKGMSVYLESELVNYGETPKDKEILNLISWLNEKELPPTYYTESLAFEYKPASGFKDKACGLFILKITPLSNHYVLFYKPEFINMIAWAGDPATAIKSDGKAYSPRDSFESYLETIENHSSPWTRHDIKSATLIHSLVTTKQLQDLLQNQARYDPLTQLLNRRFMEQTLNLELQRALRGSHSLAILLADLDHFKKINDRFGHPAGDAMLQSFAELIKKEFRSYDYIYRYGGEEFLIILPNTSVETALNRANQLLTKTKNMQVEYNDSILPSITLSIGISIFPENGDDARKLITCADAALYRAKSKGRNRVVIAENKNQV